MRPVSLQIELTHACNNACLFCYNKWNKQLHPLPLEVLKTVLKDVREYGIFSVNFNGGEPLLYPDFFELADYCKRLGLDIHCNTNATLISKNEAKNIAEYFPAICTSVLGDVGDLHDKIVDRPGAFDETMSAISFLKAEGVYVAANVTLCKQNIGSVERIFDVLIESGVETLLLTRVLTADLSVAVSDEELLAAFLTIKHKQEGVRGFRRIAFPQPFPLCRCFDNGLLPFIEAKNIACFAGALTARIRVDGEVTPCPILDEPHIGNVKQEPFSQIWTRFEKTNWKKPSVDNSCHKCKRIPFCGCGCIPIDKNGVIL